ncbi:YeiH family protein [Arachnia propionica]|uniref:Putative sulfate exporter family transporter n=1 Tax=Arachnia propionica TaxID=1750 RepID=A0A3P1WRH9_9ACTN|nr:putative sulfate exporter family transporter [Arachnia propionica]RRD06333.1 putative sulfate exporter family transporter [Arachnia propionica]RRD48556.1 putative sulfate exporter family transporter [Arachnia propionica]
MTPVFIKGLLPLLPGAGLCLVTALISYGLSLFLPTASPLIIAIVLGITLTNVLPLQANLSPGIDFSAKKLLRAGIILLGLRLVLGDILALGAPMLLVVVCIVTGGLVGTLLLGRWLRIPTGLSLLVACGFSICGAAAVAGACGVIDPDDEHEQDTITAIALVVIFGTLMIPLVPLVAALLGMEPHVAGMWAGGSIHEIAQVVAVGGIIGGGALTIAVVVKLARVLLLAPVIAILSLRQRRIAQRNSSRTKLPPIVPPFVLGFLAMVCLRSFVALPQPVLDLGAILQTTLLAAAMFALGCGVKIRALCRVGPRPFALAALSTVLVAGIACTGIALT